MVTLLSAVTLSVFFAVFATQNTGVVSLNFGQYSITDIPIYLVALLPMAIGIFVALFFHLTNGLSQKLTINEQREELKKLKKEIAEASKRVHQLEIENIKIKNDGAEETDEDTI